jgi:hypothetical protein
MDEQLKKVLQAGTKRIEAQIQISASKYGFSKKIKVRLKPVGDDFKITIELPRYAILRHKGVGKGRGINSGKTIPDNFINKVLEVEIKTLSEEISKHYSSTFINMSKF